jgi:hypothetical protein
VLSSRTWLATRTTRLVHLVAVSGWVDACVPLQGAIRGGSSDRDTRRRGGGQSVDRGYVCAWRIGISDLQIGGSRGKHDSLCAASWGSYGRCRQQVHADRGAGPRPRTWRFCPRSRSPSPWLRLPSLSSGRSSHWVSGLRNGRRVRSSFEQGRRLLAGIGDGSMGCSDVAAAVLVFPGDAWCCCRRCVSQRLPLLLCCSSVPCCTCCLVLLVTVEVGCGRSARVAAITVACAGVAIIFVWV